MFLYILSHHIKNRPIKTEFLRSGKTISKYFYKVLKAILELQGVLLKLPEPFPQKSTDKKRKWFKVIILSINFFKKLI